MALIKDSQIPYFANLTAMLVLLHKPHELKAHISKTIIAIQNSMVDL